MLEVGIPAGRVHKESSAQLGGVDGYNTVTCITVGGYRQCDEGELEG